MLRVTTIHASSAAASAAYYTRCLADAPLRRAGRVGGSDDEGRVGLVGAGECAGEVGAQAPVEHRVLACGLDVSERSQQRTGAVGGRTAAETMGGGADL